MKTRARFWSNLVAAGRRAPLRCGILLAALQLSFGLNVLSASQPLSPKDTEAARKLYTAKCAKCHKFYDPNAYSHAEWEVWMGKMRKKSKLKADQFELISRYINTLRAEEKAEIKPK